MFYQDTSHEEPRRGLLVDAARFASDLVWTSYGLVRLMIALHKEQQDDQDWWQVRSGGDDHEHPARPTDH